MAPTAFEKAERDRTAIKDNIDFLEQVLTDHNNGTSAATREEADKFREEADQNRIQLTDNMKELRLAAPKDKDMNPYVQEFQTLKRAATKLHSSFHGIFMSFPPPANPAATATTTSSKPNIKLPPLELPQFGGDLQQWVPFRDLYVTAIHSSSLSKVEKLTQLKGRLTGEAARLVRSLPLTEGNYDIAWKALTDRYENNRELLFTIMRRLIGQASVSTASSSGLRSLVDTTKECIRSLEVMSIQTKDWDAILLYLLFTKLDSQSRELWEQSLPDTNIPKLDKMYDFVEQRARALAASNVQSSSRNPPQYHVKSQQQAKTHHLTQTNCKVGCNEHHPLFRCPKFQQQSSQQRMETVKRLRLCINCYHNGHNASQCPSKHNCKVCNRRHNTMLHDGSLVGRQLAPPNPPRDPTPTTGDSTASVQSHHLATTSDIPTGILATARIGVVTPMGYKTVRSLVDGGSTNTQIMRRTAKQLRLHLRPVHIPMTGPQEVSCGTARHVTTFQFTPHFNTNITHTVTALVVEKISGYIPAQQLPKSQWPHLQGLQLADPKFEKPDEVEVLLGTDIVWTILENEKRDGLDGQPHAIKTTLGWLIGGQSAFHAPAVQTFNSIANLDYTLRRFWEQEEPPHEVQHTKEEKFCEAHFTAETTRDNKTGRFTVCLPFKDPRPELGTSRQAAVRRFLSLERKYTTPIHKDISNVSKTQQQWQMYRDFMLEYKTLNHMEVVPIEEVNAPDTYYIPHHAVFKDSSTTTKLRVVFDASATTSTGNSLNDCMMVGPTLQDGIWDIMLRFRLYPIAFTADIAKMYRQILVNRKHIDFQRIIWRDHPSQPLQDYRLLTVTYGTASAPYLAVKCLRQLAQDERDNYPLASEVALRDFYVDDLASSCVNLDTAKEVVQQLLRLCNSGSLELRKWTSNSSELLNSIPADLRETNSLIELQQDSSVKTLGIFWRPLDDIYTFQLSLPKEPPQLITKRHILSEIAKIYDPLGWLSPTIITSKIFMQELWKLKHDWNDIVPATIQQQWLDIRNSLFDLEEIKIPRCVIPSTPTKLILIGCSDASTKAISACVYILAEYNDQITTCNLMTSKTRVAPLKPVTLPRLELNGAVLLSELLQSVWKATKLPFNEIRAFTDSMIVLHWIRSSPTKWKVYVRNRVQAVQDNCPTAMWSHIPGDINPADCASRGITARELASHPNWWTGVPDLFNHMVTTAELKDDDITQLEKEEQVKVHHGHPAPLPPYFTKFSTFMKLQHVISYVLRFIHNTRSTQRIRRTGYLTVVELRSAHNVIIWKLQQTCFPQEYSILTSKQPLPGNNSLLKLQPFLGEDGLIRVGGRLRNANIPYQQKHPILLPRGHQITINLIRQYHLLNMHTGATATLTLFQSKYWITSARDAIRAVIRKCCVCSRMRAEMLTQVMGDLPPQRVNQSRPFQKVGVDYAGPIGIKPMVRSKVSLKCWLAVFVCLATRAVHIEVVSSLSTECFLAAFRRFCSRRGKPSEVFSDCGTNFKGADKVLRDWFTASSRKEIQEDCSSQEIIWNFNPPGAPHFGGLWEAGVKSIKHHLVRVMGSTVLTYEEMHTLVTQIEGILNSRPLVPVSTDPTDLEALTPAHFLIGAPITAHPEEAVEDVKENHLKRWQLIQQRQQTFWRRWSQEYLTRLQQRPKWMKVSSNLQPNAMVIIKEDRLPPLKWKLGRVVKVHPGQDGNVRVATVKTQDGEIKRPIVKLSVLPIN